MAPALPAPGPPAQLRPHARRHSFQDLRSHVGPCVRVSPQGIETGMKRPASSSWCQHCLQQGTQLRPHAHRHSFQDLCMHVRPMWASCDTDSGTPADMSRRSAHRPGTQHMGVQVQSHGHACFITHRCAHVVTCTSPCHHKAAPMRSHGCAATIGCGLPTAIQATRTPLPRIGDQQKGKETREPRAGWGLFTLFYMLSLLE